MSTEPTAEEFDCRADLPKQLHDMAQAILFLVEQRAAGIAIVDPYIQFESWFILVRESEPRQDEN